MSVTLHLVYSPKVRRNVYTWEILEQLLLGRRELGYLYFLDIKGNKGTTKTTSVRSSEWSVVTNCWHSRRSREDPIIRTLEFREKNQNDTEIYKKGRRWYHGPKGRVLQGGTDGGW